MELQYSIVRSNLMLSKIKSHRSLLSENISLHQLNKLNSFLDSEQHQTKYVNKEIKNQIQMAKKNDKIISRNIEAINQNGEEIVRKYEEEKEKYQKLEFLVKHIEEEIYKAKMDKANDLKNNIETDKLTELTDILSTRQKQLERNCEKVNTSSYDVSKKLDTIRALRSQRTIVSDLFDNLERQLCNLEHCYKVLVIQRKKQEDQLGRAVEEFNRCELQGHREIMRQKEKVEKLKEKKVQVKINAKINTEPDLKDDKRISIAPSFFQEDSLKVPPSQRKRSSASKEKAYQREKTVKFESDLYKVKRQGTVKQILHQLGVSNVQQLPEDINSIDTINSSLLRQTDRLFDQIVCAQQRLSSLNSKARHKKHGGKEESILQLKKEEIKQRIEQIRRNRLELMQFREGCKILIERVREAQGKELETHDFLNDEEEIVYYMDELQKYFVKSYLDKESKLSSKPKKNKEQPKRLTYLLSPNQLQHNALSIYEEKDLLEFAKKNLERIEKGTQR